MRIWTEPYEPTRHVVPYVYRDALESRLRAPSFIPNNVLIVNVASFTFHFVSLQQVRDCLAHFELKIHPSSRLPLNQTMDYGDSGEAQRWFDQLPMYLLEDARRKKVIKALTKALEITDENSFVSPPTL